LFEFIKQNIENDSLRGNDAQNALRLFNREFSNKVVYEDISKHIEKVFSATLER